MELLDRQPSENARSYALRVLLHNIITLELAPGSAVPHPCAGGLD